ncbi:MAG: hypothetical protein EOP87_00910 [Verrucomicrobiaceae bacterium]|nr:MAG: hypothetical protein EOP87_00910 [Verrucomicrobiaceae bacterium]
MAFTIKGEAGASMNATARTFSQLGILECQLKFQSLSDDTLTWTSRPGAILPELGQVVELLDGATRRFWGNVTKLRPRGNRVTVEVSGPWWWMTRIKLSSNRTDPNGGTDTRAQYLFPTGDLRGMVIDLMDRAIAEDVPMERGTGTQIAEMYDVSKVTLSDMSYAAALAKLLSKVPDSGTWFDYGTGSTLPRLKVVRRGGADAMLEVALEVGTDPIEELDIQPRLDLQIARVELPFLDRHPVTGKPRFQKQASGTAAPGKLQIVTVSGPEIVDQLPLEDFESYNIQTASGITADWVKKHDPQLAALNEQYGILGGVATSVTTYSGSGISRKATTRTFPGIKFRRDNGKAVTITGKYLVLTDNVPDWAMKAYKGVRVTVTGTWVWQWKDSIWGVSSTPNAAFRAMEAGSITGKGKESSVTVGETSFYDNEWLARPFSAQGVLINTKFGNPKNVYKPWDFDFLSPPAGMASGLRQAQNWVPWEGTIRTVHDTVSGHNLLLARVINLTGDLAECATMKAMVKAVSYDLMRGRRTIHLGSPARLDFGTAVGRVANAPQDVVIIS